MVASSKWQKLIDAAGGLEAAGKKLGISRTGMWRLLHGEIAPDAAMQDRVLELCRSLGITPPFKVQRRLRNKDLTTLELIGAGLAKGLKPPEKALKHAASIYPPDQLVELAEDDQTPSNVLRAVSAILGL